MTLLALIQHLFPRPRRARSAHVLRCRPFHAPPRPIALHLSCVIIVTAAITTMSVDDVTALGRHVTVGGSSTSTCPYDSMCTLERAEALVVPGDTLYLWPSGGDYPAYIWRANGDSADASKRITIRGVGSQVAWGGRLTIRGSYLNVKFLTFKSGVTVDTLYRNNIRRSVRRLLMEDCTFSSDDTAPLFAIRGADHSVFRRLIGDTIQFKLSGSALDYAEAAPDTVFGELGGWAVGDTFQDCSFRVRSLPPPAHSQSRSDNQCALTQVSNAVFERCRWYQVTRPNDAGAAFMKLFRTKHTIFRDCSWDLHCLNDTDEGGYWLTRDDTRFVTFLRDTFVFHGPATNTKLITTGNTYGVSSNLTFDSCLVRNKVNVGMYFHHPFSGNAIRHSVIVGAGSDVAGAMHIAWDTGGGSIIEHNTLVSYTTGPALFINDEFNPSAPVEIMRNIFYTNSADTMAAYKGAAYVGTIRGNTLAHLTQYDNLFWTKVGPSKSIAYWSNGLKYSPPGFAGSWYTDTGSGYDAISGWGYPYFADSAFATFDATPTVGSAAIDTKWGSQMYVGAKYVDLIPPQRVLDLADAGKARNTVILTWTAVGDDELYGTASAYDLRYSTSNITQANFGSATQVSVAAPNQAYTTECTEVHGLSPCTTYYFALKVRDEAGNWSWISNVDSTSTKCSGVSTMYCAGERATSPPEELAGGRPEIVLLSRVVENGRIEWRTSVPQAWAGLTIEMVLLDIAGRRIVRNMMPARPGVSVLGWSTAESGVDVRPGVYFVRVRIGKEESSDRIIFLR